MSVSEPTTASAADVAGASVHAVSRTVFMPTAAAPPMSHRSSSPTKTTREGATSSVRAMARKGSASGFPAPLPCSVAKTIASTRGSRPSARIFFT